jgi:hypothetical protein
MKSKQILFFLCIFLFLGSFLFVIPNLTPSFAPITLQDESSSDTLILSDLDELQIIEEDIIPKSALNTAKWTFMVYLAADNNLESAGIKDLNEMEMVGSTSDIQIVVQMDRISDYDSSNGNWVDTRRFYIEKDSSQTLIGSTGTSIGETNTGDPTALRNFIEWSQTNYPAEKYALILWDHGSGVMWGSYVGGICWDDSNSRDYLTLTEIQSALSGKQIDLLGFDACLMASAEFYYGLQNYASILVGSQANEPGDGWPYDTILNWLKNNPTASSSQLGSIIVDRYIEFYPSNIAITHSAVSSAGLGSIQTAASVLATNLIQNISTLKSVLSSIRGDMYSYNDQPYVDLYDFALRVNNTIADPTIKTLAQALLNAITTAIINNGYHTVQYSSSHGLTVYFPNTAAQFSNTYRTAPWCTDGNWDEFLLSYYSSSALDDQFEDNDQKESAAEIRIGYHPGLIWSDEDWYKIYVEDNQTITFSISYSHGTGADLDLYVYNSTEPTSINSSKLSTGFEIVSWLVEPVDQFIYLRVVNVFSGILISYSLTVHIPIEDDLYEENDFWTNATLFSPINGTWNDLVAFDLDWYRISVSGTALVTIDLEFRAVAGILSLDVYGGANAISTPKLLYSRGSANDNEFFQFSTDDRMESNHWFEEYGVSFDYYYIVIVNYQNNSRYNLTISVDPGADDIYENKNDYVSSNTPVLSEGLYSNLTCIDYDLYNISLNAGQWVNISLDFKNKEGDLDLYLKDASLTTIAISYFWSDGEFIIYQAIATGIYTIFVFPYEINLNYSLSINKSQSFWNDSYDGTNHLESQINNFPIIDLGTHYANLTAWQDDFFKIYLQAGKTAVITLNYSNYDSTLLLALYRTNNLDSYIKYSYTPGTEEFIQFKVSTTGYYIIKVWVIQPVGNYELYCFYDTEPTIAFTYTNPSPFVVDFSANIVSVDGIESITWNFGDGTTYTGMNTTVTHVYSEIGVYQVILYVNEFWDMYSYSERQIVRAYAIPSSTFQIELIQSPNAQGKFVVGWNITNNAASIQVYAENHPFENITGLTSILTDPDGEMSSVEISPSRNGMVYVRIVYSNPFGTAISNMLEVNITQIQNPPSSKPRIPGYSLLSLMIFTFSIISYLIISKRRKLGLRFV